MDLKEQESLQMLRQQNLLLLEQLRRGQNTMKSLLNGGVPLNTSPSRPVTNRQPASPIQKLTTPKKNVSFSEKDFRYAEQRDALNTSLMSESRHNGDTSLSQLERQVLIQGNLDDSQGADVARSSLASATLTSTPNKTSATLNDTPRSILKRRKIIDDNVRVQSKFAHTPTYGRSPRNKRGLNHSYTDYDDLDYAMERLDLERDNLTSLSKGRHSYSDAKDGSYIEEYLDMSAGDMEKDLKEIQSRRKGEGQSGSQNSKKREAKSEEIEELLKKRLMKDSGNDRMNAHIVRDLSRRQPSESFKPRRKPEVLVDKSPTHSSARRNKSPKASDKKWAGQKEKPLLGYDWIAGTLENDNTILSQQDEYFKDLEDFRRSNKGDCVSDTFSHNFIDLTKPIEPVVENPSHTCIHGYSVSDRLYTEPMKRDEDGTSICPICLVPRKQPTAESPGFVRVSIPRSTLESPYKIKPHRRRSYDPTDTCALSNHCLAGWESSKPSQIPAASSVDITRASENPKLKYSQSLSEAEKEAMSYSRQSRLLAAPSAKPDHSSRSYNTSSQLNTSKTAPLHSSRYPRGRLTDELLNTSHDLRFQLQQLEQERELSYRNPPHSTKYPML